MSVQVIDSVENFISEIKDDYQGWNTKTFPWFRGEPSIQTPLLPKLYRQTKDGGTHDENQLLQFFRMKAPSMGFGETPDRAYTDQWLFLMQHVGLPTRLLDWTESALVALYFGLLEEKPIVWMLNPVELNRLSVSEPNGLGDNEFGLTWHTPPGHVNIASANINGAWEKDAKGVDLPVSIHPTNIHPRMSAQKSCFTVHGKKKECLSDLISSEHLKKYEIEPERRKEMFVDLRMQGMSHATLFPDLEGLAEDLSRIL